jgi:hypothetical protein
MPPQLKRLIPLFIIFIGLFLVIRHLLVPESFGQYGHYRGDALQEITAQEMKVASKAMCVECHWDVQEIIENDSHANLSCIICHGEGLAHIENPEASNIEKISGREFCGTCHGYNPARPMDVVFQVDLGTHNPDFENCSDCHHPHQVWEGLQ